MSIDQLLAFCAFAVITSLTPGPNNLMVLSSGLHYGVRRSLPHLAGISLGFGFMVIGTGFGLHVVFVRFPVLHTFLKYAGTAYLLWLAWQLARASHVGSEARRSQPLSFLGAAAFQWVNPKAWVMAVGALTTYLPASFSARDVILMGFLFSLISVPCVGVWASCGSALRRFLQHPHALRIFNLSAAGLLIASLYPTLVD